MKDFILTFGAVSYTTKVSLGTLRSHVYSGEVDEVRMIWVSGHSVTRGNAAADALTNRAAGTVFTGPQFICGISKFVANQFIQFWMRTLLHTASWR